MSHFIRLSDCLFNKDCVQGVYEETRSPYTKADGASERLTRIILASRNTGITVVYTKHPVAEVIAAIEGDE